MGKHVREDVAQGSHASPPILMADGFSTAPCIGRRGKWGVFRSFRSRHDP